jgi:hypothetical protein
VKGLQADSLGGKAAKHERSSMTAIENLRALKLQLEQQQLKASPSAEEREWIEGELMKIDIPQVFE